METILAQAITEAGGPRMVGNACGVTYQAVLKWIAKGRLPRTEWTGETSYAKTISGLTNRKYSRKQLLTFDAAA